MGEVRGFNNENERHAFLIMVHTDMYTVKALFRMLDYDSNTIFLNVDPKFSDFSIDEIQTNNLTIAKILNNELTWGDYSQVACELQLLKYAVDEGPFHYYHLLSGQDLPIKDHDHIMDFFRNEDKIFINRLSMEHFEYRVDRLYPLQKFIGRGSDVKSNLYRILQKQLMKETVQQNRGKEVDFKQYKNSQWFSIPEYAARYLLECEAYIYYRYKDAMNTDEACLATLFSVSPYADKIASFNCRFEDWETHYYSSLSSPEVLTFSRFEEVFSSNMLFARKFDSKIDWYVIKALQSMLCGKTNDNDDFGKSETINLTNTEKLFSVLQRKEYILVINGFASRGVLNDLASKLDLISFNNENVRDVIYHIKGRNILDTGEETISIHINDGEVKVHSEKIYGSESKKICVEIDSKYHYLDSLGIQIYILDCGKIVDAISIYDSISNNESFMVKRPLLMTVDSLLDVRNPYHLIDDQFVFCNKYDYITQYLHIINVQKCPLDHRLRIIE